MRQWDHPCKRSKARRPTQITVGSFLDGISVADQTVNVGFSITGGDKMKGYMSGKPMVGLTLFMANQSVAKSALRCQSFPSYKDRNPL
jgi:hypothetical protein